MSCVLSNLRILPRRTTRWNPSATWSQYSDPRLPIDAQHLNVFSPHRLFQLALSSCISQQLYCRQDVITLSTDKRLLNMSPSACQRQLSSDFSIKNLRFSYLHTSSGWLAPMAIDCMRAVIVALLLVNNASLLTRPAAAQSTAGAAMYVF